MEAGPPGGRMSSDGLVLETTAAALHAQGAGSTPADDGGKPGLSSASPRQPPEQDQPDSPQNGISNDGSGGKPAAVLTVLRPLSARSSLEGGSRPAEPAPAAAPQQPGWAAAGPSLGPAGAHVAPGEEAATEYAVVWARLLQVGSLLEHLRFASWVARLVCLVCMVVQGCTVCWRKPAQPAADAPACRPRRTCCRPLWRCGRMPASRAAGLGWSSGQRCSSTWPQWGSCTVRQP